MSGTTVPVKFEVQALELVRFGRVLALANVCVEVAGIGFTIQGCRIVRGRAGGLTVEGPQWQHPRQRREFPAILLPPELRDAIGGELLAAFPA